MAEKRRNSRGHRRAWSILSLAGTATAIWAGTGLGGDGQATASQMSAEASATGLDHSTSVDLASSVDLDIAPAAASSEDGAAMAVLPEVAAAVEVAAVSEPFAAVEVGQPAVAAVVAAAPVATGAEALSGVEAVGQAALARITYPWQSVLDGWTIEFLDGRSGMLGGTWTYEKRIEIYVRADHTVEEVAFTLAHELGHAVDVTLFTDAERTRWRAARGITNDVPWWVESGMTDFSSVSGDWAETFAVWQVGGWSHSLLGGQPAPEQLALLAALAS